MLTAHVDIDRLDDFRALKVFVASVQLPAWDNLAHVDALARALRFVRGKEPFDAPFVEGAPAIAAHPDALLARATGAVQRRCLVEALLKLLPAATRERLGAVSLRLPVEVAVRETDGFALRAGDVPTVAAALSAHLTDAVSQIVVPGAVLLASKNLCPPAARGHVVCARVVAVHGDVAHLEVALHDGTWSALRLAPDGQPVRFSDGKPQPITCSVDALLGYVLGAGPDARGLDLRSIDDRALLLRYAHALRTRGVFYALRDVDSGSSAADKNALVQTCVHAAVDAINCALDPLSSAVVLASHDGDQGWPARAWALLRATDCVRDAPLRDSPAGFVKHAVWADALLSPGFAGGRLSALAAGRAFARLCTSMLAPLGVLPCSGMKDGSGDVVLHTLRFADDDDARALAPVQVVQFGAAARIRNLSVGDAAALWMADPRMAPRHEIAALGAWLEFFVAAIGSTAPTSASMLAPTMVPS